MNVFTSHQSFLKLVILENDEGGSSWNNKSNFSWKTERVDLLSVTEYVCIIDCFLAICLKVLALIQYGDIACTDFLLMKMLCYFNNQKQRAQLFFFILYSLGLWTVASRFQTSISMEAWFLIFYPLLLLDNLHAWFHLYKETKCLTYSSK